MVNPNILDTIERSSSNIDVIKDNFLVWKGLNEKDFNTLLESFGDEKENNKVLLSNFLNSKNIKLIDLGNIKINIDTINNFVRNKPNFPKSIEKKIARLYLEKLYENGQNIPGFVEEFENRFCPIQELEKGNFDFKKIQIGTRGVLGDIFDLTEFPILQQFSDVVKETSITNDDLFSVLNLNKIQEFQHQTISAQDTILNVLEFEVRDLIKGVKDWGESAIKDMRNVMLPTSMISEIFDKVKDPEIEQLIIEKGKLMELGNLIFSKDIYQDKVSLKEYIKSCKKVGINEKLLSKLEKLLLGAINEKKVREFYYYETKRIKKRIWEKYIENFEKKGMNPEFISAIKKLLEHDFNFSQLNKREQTILWNTLIVNNIDKTGNKRANYTGFDQEEFQKFMQDLYDFEKDDLNLTIDGVGNVKFKIKKEVKSTPIASFSDVENFKDMSMTQPIRFTVNIDDNDEEIIQDLESEGENGDNILRLNGLMETHMTKGGPINIGNGYELEICGKAITKKQLDDLLLCRDLQELNEMLKEIGLYEELKDEVYSTRKEIFSPQNVYPNLDEDGFDMGPTNDSGEISLSDKYSIFEEALKKIDVKVKKRNLIFNGNNMNALSQLYILSKSAGDSTAENMGKVQDEKTKKILGDYDRNGDDEELGGRDKGEEYATNYWGELKSEYQSRDGSEGNGSNPDDGGGGDDGDDSGEYTIEGEVRNHAEEHWNNLNEEGQGAFADKLHELCNNDTDLQDDEKESLNTAIDNMLDEFRHSSNDTDATDNDGTDTGNTDNADNTDTTDTAENHEDLEKDRRAAWDGLSGDKDAGAKKENQNEEDEEERESIIGCRLYFDLGESQLPPKDIADTKKSFYGFKVVKVDNDNKTFTLKAIGGDLKSSLVGTEYELSMSKEQLDSITKKGSVYKVRTDDSRDWAYCLESINRAGFFKKFTAFGDMEGQVHFDGNKFVNEKGEEVKYFDRIEGSFDDTKPEVRDRGQGYKLSKYEIKKIDKTKGTVTITSNFSGYDDKYKEINYNYENELEFEQFILLMEGKRLKGYTKQEQEEMETKYTINDPKRLATKGRRRWISIGSIINVFNNTKKAIKGKLDENQKDQEDVLENYLFSEEGLNLYGKSRWLLGDTAEKLQYEFYTNRENRTRKKIEEWYKIFESDPKYSEFFAEHLQHILARKGDISRDKDRYKFAAAFLIMVKKEGPYPRVFGDLKGKGKRVENFLGSKHKERFLNLYEKKKNDIEQERDLGHQSGVRLALQEELNKMELQYIISTIDGRAPLGPGTVSNEYMLKSIWSQNFMQKLEENMKGYYSCHDEEKQKLDTFYAAEESYIRNVGSSQLHKALAALERMCETAKTPGDVERVKGYMLGAMLTGIIINDRSTSVVKSFWATCRSMGFTPGFWMRDVEQQYKVKILLDGVTNGEFSKETKFNVSDFKPGNIKDGKYSFTKKFQSYWNSHSRDILKKIENPTYKKGDGDKSIIDLANEKSNPNSYIFKDIINNSTTNEIDSTNEKVPPIFAQESPLSATSNIVKLYIPENAKYSKVRSEEDISQAQDFRSAAAKVIPTESNATQETVDFMFKKYFNRFDTKINSDVQTSIVRSIKLIQDEKKNEHFKNARLMLWYMFKGTIHESTHGAFPKPEFDDVMDKFVEFFYNNVEKIKKSTIKSTFNDDAAIDFETRPYEMLNWKQYSTYKMTTNGGRNKNKYDRLVRLALHKKGKDTYDAINTKICEIWNRIRNYDPPTTRDESTGDGYGIRVNMELSDKDIQAAENAAYNS